jgi:hypothetical protein
MVAYRWTYPEEHPLRRYCLSVALDERDCMNLLQEHGVVSDNAVTIDDVGNWPRAMMWIDSYRRQALRSAAK